MGFLFFALALSVVGEFLWFKFYRNGKKQFKKYDKEHSNVTALGAEEFVSKLNKLSSFNIGDIDFVPNQVRFTCKKSSYTVNIENGIAYVEYDMSGCGARVSLIGRLTGRFKFWRSAHNAMLINAVMDTFQNDGLPAQKEYQKTKIYAKASVVAFVASLIFLIVGIPVLAGSVSDKTVSEVKEMEFRDNVTYEEVIDAYLQDAEWTSFNSEKDIVVVEINGTSVEGEKICIQFWGDLGMGYSYTSLTLKVFEADETSLDPYGAMEYIYTYYYLNE